MHLTLNSDFSELNCHILTWHFHLVIEHFIFQECEFYLEVPE